MHMKNAYCASYRLYVSNGHSTNRITYIWLPVMPMNLDTLDIFDDLLGCLIAGVILQQLPVLFLCIDRPLVPPGSEELSRYDCGTNEPERNYT